MKLSLKLASLAFAAVLASCTTTDTPDPVPSEAENTANEANSAARGIAVDPGNVNDRRTQEVAAPLNSVFYFEFDKSTLTAQTRRDLDAYASQLRSSPRNIRLEGHADERGTREYNIALGERRAKSVADYLIASGVNANRIEVISYGEERPAVSGSTRVAWQQNRRVELK